MQQLYHHGHRGPIHLLERYSQQSSELDIVQINLLHNIHFVTNHPTFLLSHFHLETKIKKKKILFMYKIKIWIKFSVKRTYIYFHIKCFYNLHPGCQWIRDPTVKYSFLRTSVLTYWFFLFVGWPLQYKVSNVLLPFFFSYFFLLSTCIKVRTMINRCLQGTPCFIISL